MTKASIVSTASYLPKKVLSNKDLEEMVDTTDEWIFTRTGMSERRIAEAEEFTSDMGIQAAKEALELAQMSPEEVELIIVATSTPDYVFPSTAALIQRGIGAKGAVAFDVQAACTGYIYGLSIARAYIESGTYKNILLVATEKLSSIVNYEDRATCILFGDGAAASLICADKPGFEIRQVCLGADGEVAELLMLPGGGCRVPVTQESMDEKRHFISMEGREIFKHAVRRMEMAAQECLDKAGMSMEQISWLVPHQANIRIIDVIAKRFGVADEKVYKTVHKYGNTSASTIPIAMHELTSLHKVEEGEHLLLIAFGGGLTWGATILKKVN